MKVSLSASFSNDPKVEALLKTCDLIYTTQVRNRDVLYALFGMNTVRFIPDTCSDIVAFLMTRHQEDEVIDFTDLYRLHMEGKQ